MGANLDRGLNVPFSCLPTGQHARYKHAMFSGWMQLGRSYLPLCTPDSLERYSFDSCTRCTWSQGGSIDEPRTKTFRCRIPVVCTARNHARLSYLAAPFLGQSLSLLRSSTDVDDVPVLSP